MTDLPMLPVDAIPCIKDNTAVCNHADPRGGPGGLVHPECAAAYYGAMTDLDAEVGTLREEIKERLLNAIDGTPAPLNDDTLTAMAFAAKAVAVEYRRQAERMLNAEIGSLRQRLAEKEEQAQRCMNNEQEINALNGKLALLLTKTADALHGGTREDTLWSFSDLADLVVAERNRADAMAQAINRYLEATLHVGIERPGSYSKLVLAHDDHARAREAEAAILAKPLMWDAKRPEPTPAERLCRMGGEVFSATSEASLLVCTLPTGHDGPHSNGAHAWEIA